MKLLNDGMSEREAEAAAEEEEYRLTDLGRQDRTALRAFIDEWWIEATDEFYLIIENRLRKDGITDEDISAEKQKIASALDKKDGEDRKELIVELIEGYYENLIEPDEDDFWEEFLEELFEDA